MLIDLVTLAALIFTALLMGTSFAHALELPAKMKVDGLEWLRMQLGLYRGFAVIGAPIEIAAIVATLALTSLVREDAFGLILVSTAFALLVFGFAVVWLGVTQKVNQRTLTWASQGLPSDWDRWRERWEYSHVVRFAIHLVALVALILARLRGV